MLNKEELQLIEPLRREAYEVKDCFTQHAFQALAGAIVVLGLVLEFQQDNPFVGVAGILVAVFCLGVVRVGVHKFETANRIHGFDLYLHRRIRLRARHGGWQPEMRKIGWEEAFYAWRVIQPRVYHAIYRKSRNWFIKTRPIAPDRKAMKWMGAGGGPRSERLHAGNYLRNTIFVLHVVAVFALLPLAYMTLQTWLERYALPLGEFRIPLYPLSLIVTIVMSGVVVLRIRRISAKRKILEDGLVSVNSCAILWHAVVLAHFRALESIGASRAADWTLDQYRGYTDALHEQAVALIANLDDIYDWTNGLAPVEARNLS